MCEFHVKREQRWRGDSAELTTEGDDRKYVQMFVERALAIDRLSMR